MHTTIRNSRLLKSIMHQHNLTEPLELGKQMRHVPLPPPITTLMCPFFFLIKLDEERFCLKNSFHYLIFLLAVLAILSYLECCNSRNLQSSWAFTTHPIWWAYRAPYGPTRFLLHENYKCPLQTLPLQRLRPPNSPVKSIIPTTATTKI